MTGRPDEDTVGFTGRRWAELGMPQPEHFTAMSEVLRISALLNKSIDRALKPFRVSKRGLLVMITLFVDPDSSKALGQLSKILMVHPTTVTLTIDQLESAGLVERRPHPTDRRTVLASLTETGQQTMKQIADSLAESDFGFPAAAPDSAHALTVALHQVRTEMGDA